MSVLFDWKIQDIERTANEAKNRLYELDSLRRDVGSMEYSLRDSCSEVDGLRNELHSCQERIQQLEARLDELTLSTNE